MKNIYTLSILLFFFLSFTKVQAFDTTANVTTPGTLNIVAKTYLTYVYSLTVTGTIDARDFKTLRDSTTTDFQVLDLSGATIAAYTGKAGTQDTNSDYYPANAIPQYAFSNFNVYI